MYIHMDMKLQATSLIWTPMGQKILSFGVGIHRGVLSLELSHVYTTKIEESYLHGSIYVYITDLCIAVHCM